MSALPAPESVAHEPRELPASYLIPYAFVTIPAGARTLAGFIDWVMSPDYPDRGKLSYIEGDIVLDMTPEEINAHNRVKLEVMSVLTRLIKKSDLGELFIRGALLVNEEADLSTEPDCFFATWETLEEERLRFVRSEKNPDAIIRLEGTPDWVLEIVSDTSEQTDMVRLARSYYRAGVSEYWLIDARGETIDFQILVRGGSAFEAVAPRSGGWLPSGVFDRRFRLHREKDEFDFWVYTLETKRL
jgi:Uma2 family endonuclease